MRLVKTIRFYYWLYTGYTLYIFTISDYDIIALIFGLLSIWTIYFAFLFGFSTVRPSESIEVPSTQKTHVLFERINEWSIWKYAFHAFACIICSILSVKFYTGKGIYEVISAIISGRSVYREYQLYFKQEGIAAFSLDKIVYIIMLTYLTIMLFWGFVGILIPNKKKRVSEIVFLLFLTIAYLYFGIARGTNFEMYIVFVLLVYALLNKQSSRALRKKLSKKSILLIVGVGVVMILIFRIVVEARGDVFHKNISNEINYNENSLVARLFPTITDLVLAVFSYVGFGVSAIGFFIKDITFSSFSNFIAYFIPFGYPLLQDMSMREVTNEAVLIGVKWVPDYLQFIGWLGFFLLLVFVYAIGYMGAKAINNKNVSQLLTHLVGMVIFLQMISFPIGNFILTSTPITLTVLIILLYYMNCSLNIRFKRL